MDVFKIAEHCNPLEGWTPPKKTQRLAELARDAALCVEVGAYGCKSLIPMALGANGPCRVVGIDPYSSVDSCEGWPEGHANNAWWGKLSHDWIKDRAMKACEEARPLLRPGVTLELLIKRGDQVVDSFEDGSIDLLHIDGNHAEEVALKDVNEWTPKVKRGGWLVFDDINWSETLKAQQRLKEIGFKLVEDYTTWGLFHK